MTDSKWWNSYLALPGKREKGCEFRVPSERETASEFHVPSEGELDLEEYWMQRYVAITGYNGRWVCADSFLRRAGLALLQVIVFQLRVARVIVIVTFVIIVLTLVLTLSLASNTPKRR